jgi:hypothetical protein
MMHRCRQTTPTHHGRPTFRRSGARAGQRASAAPLAIANGKQIAGTRAVFRDCLDHYGEMTRRHSLADLRAAAKSMPDDVAMYTFCPGAIRSAIAALAGPAGTNTRAAIVGDCAGHRGALTRQYSLPALVHARHTLPRDVTQHTDCRKGIASQIHTLAR